jgi:hypothetical protein
VIFEIGDLIPLTLTLAGNDGTATLTVTDPSGAVTTTSGIVGTGGVYNGTFRAALAGRHNLEWTTTNNASQDVFEVRAVVQGVISLQDARDWLRLRSTDTADNEKLQALIETATDLIEDVTGPILTTQYTEWFDGGVGTYTVQHPPIVQASATMHEYYGLVAYLLTEQPLGGQMNAYAFTVDYSTGQVTRRTFGGQAAMFPQGTKNVTITYSARRNPVPDAIQLAVRELVKHLYTATQVPVGKARVNGAEEGLNPGVTYAVPNFVLDLIPLKYRRPPGVG